MSERWPVLILGGTTEGYALAEALDGHARWAPVSSLAGRTGRPRPPKGEMRVGGFGGPAGLARYLATRGVVAVIDATHPFASRMGWNAAEGCAAAGVPLLRLERPPWSPQTGDAWVSVQDWKEAVTVLRAVGARRVFLALGRQDLEPFTELLDTWVLIRSVEAPDPMPRFPQAEVLLARGPFSLDEETTLLRDKAIDALVCKNSGGTATAAKLAAARALGVRVIMRERPERPDTVPVVPTVAAALAWLDSPTISARVGGAKDTCP